MLIGKYCKKVRKGWKEEVENENFDDQENFDDDVNFFDYDMTNYEAQPQTENSIFDEKEHEKNILARNQSLDSKKDTDDEQLPQNERKKSGGPETKNEGKSSINKDTNNWENDRKNMQQKY